MQTMKKIALEEHFLTPAFEEYWAPTVVNIDPAIYNRRHARLVDFGSLRLDAMDRAGIEPSVLSLAGPGVQREPDTTASRFRMGSAWTSASAMRKNCCAWRAEESQQNPVEESAAWIWN